ncbi:MAG: nucleoside phosphorylase [Candidatus Heimdallarchaeum aukensis]|uniref:Nucleoside phosphorylase n=1 Tax=Candidatus Heimdallarchaeum aukensis TaxID=2876573 RepID=A0A9Y1BKN3_9ARCH|nr:MAG: nucleoside phosphorylase [Candidatus Heimdallarchaeum aukensis]
MSKKVSADKPIFEQGMQYHIECKPGDLKGPVLLPGDPERAKRIASTWEEMHQVAAHRQYYSYTGKVHGVPISVTSTGIGTPACEIAMTELVNIGCDTFIRVGSSGAIQPGIELGDLIISSGAVKMEGSSGFYVLPEYPAMAHYEVVLALIEACETLGFRYHLGITASSSSFYLGQGRPGVNDYKLSKTDLIVPDLQKMGVLNFEMEASHIFTLGQIYGLRTGAICAVYANRVTNEFATKGEKEAIQAANLAVKILHDMDLEKKEKGKKYWYRALKSL